MIKKYFEASSNLIKSLYSFEKEINQIIEKIIACHKNNNKILVVGNGGSCADAEHFVGELQCTFKKRDRSPISAFSIGGTSAALTAWSNDFDFNSFFERQVSAHGKKNDILLLISTSGGTINGSSSNLVDAAREGKKRGMTIISLIGKTGGQLKSISDISIHITSSVTSHIQEAHMAILHCICDHLENL